MATTLGRLDSLVTWPYEATWIIKSDISPSLRGLWLPKLTRWMFIVKGHHPLSLLMLWSRDQIITWQMENVISQLPRDLWLPNLTEWWVLVRAYYPSSHITCWSRDHIRSHGKWKMLWIHFLVTCPYQTWQKGGSWLGVISSITKLHIPSITWLREFTWQMNFVISLLPRGLLLLSLTGWWLVMRSHHWRSSLVLWPRDHV